MPVVPPLLLLLHVRHGRRQRGLHKVLLQLQGLPVDGFVELLILLRSWLHKHGRQAVYQHGTCGL